MSAATALPAHTDIAVIGAGITGLSAALHLARAGCEVVVLDRGDAWGEASGANAGTLSLQVKHPQVMELMQMSLDLWQQEAVTSDREVTRSGGLRVALSSREVDMLRTSVALQRRRGLDVEFLEGQALADCAPWLGGEVLAASACPRDAHSMPLSAGPGLMKAARAAGVRLVDRAGVRAIDSSDGCRLATPAGTIRCDILVIAAGAWSGEVATMLGVELPLMVDVNMLTITEPAPPFLDRVVTHMGGVLSLKQYANGTCMIGGGWQGRGSLASGKKDIDHVRLLHNLTFAARVVPALRSLGIQRCWSGFESVAPDALPVLGRLPGHRDVLIATGARGGYSLGPALGRVVAELVTTGTASVPAEPFDPARLLS